jgi:hypothetical protein
MAPLQHGPHAASDAGAAAVSEASAADASADHDTDNAAAVLEVRGTMQVQLEGRVSSVAALLPRLTLHGQAMLGRLVNDMIEACGVPSRSAACLCWTDAGSGAAVSHSWKRKFRNKLASVPSSNPDASQRR